jgi:hypothetical protein
MKHRRDGSGGRLRQIIKDCSPIVFIAAASLLHGLTSADRSSDESVLARRIGAGQGTNALLFSAHRHSTSRGRCADLIPLPGRIGWAEDIVGTVRRGWPSPPTARCRPSARRMRRDVTPESAASGQVGPPPLGAGPPDYPSLGVLLGQARHVTAPPAYGVFISYRRSDAGPYARLLQVQLAEHLHGTTVFMDLDSIEAGTDFAEAIEAAVGSCHVLIALIGCRWLTTTDEGGRRRLDDPDDCVRFEIRTALERHARVIPVLVDGATMPQRRQLPDDLASLARLNALTMSYDRYDYDESRPEATEGTTRRAADKGRN